MSTESKNGWDQLLQVAKGLGAQASAMIQDRFVRWDPADRKLSLSHAVISFVAGGSLRGLAAVETVSTSSLGSSFSLTLKTHSGISLSVNLKPLHLELSQERVSFTAELPDGLRLAHRGLIKNLVLRLISALFGLEWLIQRQFGVEFHGRSFTYHWPISSLGEKGPAALIVKSALQGGAALRGPASVPLSYQEHWLNVDLSGALPPGFSFDPAAFGEFWKSFLK